jgi:hypothetical protein
MKASDSTNSLTGLTEQISVQIEEPTCFICIEQMNEKAEPLVDSSLLRTCGCQFKVHPACWNEWMKDKTDYDCPICRKKSLTANKSPTPTPPISEWPREQQPFKQYFRASLLLIIFVAIFILIYKIVED